LGFKALFALIFSFPFDILLSGWAGLPAGRRPWGVYPFVL
jgi:cytochrome bd-type quinol oxidase subunit 1